ncbi:glycine decarboxylase subunit P [Tieghemiomyces parasiticus]|uniref:Glycine cleavage system P protein n=1 Tax=Tieghemiomyces parasiticus TaxID=78921 RepID=A0A9W8ALF1_9FUNG|nr:glycine decarboxylase subunit P [Tieghemiomyces parasiticus]
MLPRLLTARPVGLTAAAAMRRVRLPRALPSQSAMAFWARPTSTFRRSLSSAPELAPLMEATPVFADTTTTTVHHAHAIGPVFPSTEIFASRHNGTSAVDVTSMLRTLDLPDMAALIDRAVPSSIRLPAPLALGPGVSEPELLADLRTLADTNQVFRSFIGMGYTDTHVPPVILRNVLENPGWYTQYTPYQPEIAQGRLESLFNFQTVVSDLTGLPVANASLLDEGTAAAEAMALAFAAANRRRRTFFVDHACHPQTIACVQTRAEGLGIHVEVGDFRTLETTGPLEGKDELCGALVQYPGTYGEVPDYRACFAALRARGALAVCATDLLALTLLESPGKLGADIALGSSQRFGVPMGYGGPHAAFFAVADAHKRRMPGRLVGLSRDASGLPAYRLALQTREQHIRRERATSNICTAQALLANVAAMYAVYHGPEGLRQIATRVHQMTRTLARGLVSLGHTVNPTYFDTLTVRITDGRAADVMEHARALRLNLRPVSSKALGVTLDETTTDADLTALLTAFGANPTGATVGLADLAAATAAEESDSALPIALRRTTPYLTNPVFHRHRSETALLRYIHHLQGKDLSLADAMIPLGSCTMKLNATTEMIPITWPGFAALHPFAPLEQAQGYAQLADRLGRDLATITGLDTTCLQPNSGAQGEYTGLRVIRAYHQARGDSQRTVCLIPVSAHGTNAASAVLAGLEVVPVRCRADGSLDVADLSSRAERYADRLAAVMVTYPSTFGVFEDDIREVCEVIHRHGGQVYMDGANMNAQIGLTSPGHIGADVCHLNLHKTFCIPHGGGGPGVGPICVRSHLTPYLPPTDPAQFLARNNADETVGPVAAAPLGSASILPISYAYIRLMGGPGLTAATERAILHANYMRHRLAPHYKVLYTNAHGYCGHEFVIDLAPLTASAGIKEVDVAKRLQDYGFHSPTMSWPAPNTLMIEPTESEDRAELDRFCDALIAIRAEIRDIEEGRLPRDDNPLKNAPHPVQTLLAAQWDHPYSREQAAYPVPGLRERKFWPTVERVDDVQGDRVLICTCPPMEDLVKEEDRV